LNDQPRSKSLADRCTLSDAGHGIPHASLRAQNSQPEKTMRRSTVIAAVLTSLMAAAPTPSLCAQGLVSVGLGGGISTPQGGFSDNFETGWHGMATVAVGLPLVPVGLRIDGAYNRFAIKSTTPALSGTSSRVASATVNATLRLPVPGSPISPYLIGGGGMYSIGCTGSSQCGSSTNEFGWNGGLGVRVNAIVIRPFAEIRYHHVNVAGGDVQYVPITVGLYF
jgi:hypothetical protein